MSEVEVYGPLDGFKGTVGTPIYRNGREIGVVERIDLVNRTWHGVVFDHRDILEMVEEREQSMEVELDDV